MKKTGNVFLSLCFLALFVACTPGEKESPEQRDVSNLMAVDSLFQQQFEQDSFQGGVVITHHGETLYEKYLGTADRTWGIPVDEQVKFDIASVNKSMIAALVMKAVEEGELRLEDTLVNLLSGFEYEGHFHPNITLHHMLSHSSGLPDYDGVSAALRKNRYLRFKRSRFTNAEYVDFISKIEPINEPGKQFYYSNFAYHLTAIILEETYQVPFEELFREKLTEPLGLTNTVSERWNEKIIPKLAGAYTFDEEADEWHQTPFIDLSLGRRIFSTAGDLNRWAQVMDNPGYLSKESLDLMTRNHLTAIAPDMSYGYGWVIFDKENTSKMGRLDIDKPYIIHGGSTDGYKSMLININNGEYVISFVSNVGNHTQEMQLAKRTVHLLMQ